MEIRPEGAEFFVQEDGQTDMTNLIVVFRNFAKARDNGCVLTKTLCQEFHPEK
jgi:hypothetical protein